MGLGTRLPKHKLFHPRTATVYLTPLWDDNSEVLIRCYTGHARTRLYNYIVSKTEMANCYFCKLLQTAADVFSGLARSQGQQSVNKRFTLASRKRHEDITTVDEF